jgi:hypothetical protein
MKISFYPDAIFVCIADLCTGKLHCPHDVLHSQHFFLKAPA